MRNVNAGTRDGDVRSALHAKVLNDHHADPDTLVVDELGLWYGTARVDIAVVNARMHGYEIKSDRDTLERLPAQIPAYSKVLDLVTIVVGEQHLDGVMQMVPEWWGIKTASKLRRSGVTFRDFRPENTNPHIDPVAVAALLWCDELLAELEARSEARGVRGKARAKMVDRLAGILTLDELRTTVRRRLKLRGDWRALAPQT